MDEGIMPNFAFLLNEGELVQMDSVYPTVSNVAWSCFQTGKNPGKFGVFGFAELNPDLSLYIPNSSDLKAKTIWEILSANGKKIISLGVPMTYPPRAVAGILVGGFLSPSLGKAVYPVSALPKLRRPGYIIDIDPVKARESLDYFKEENLRVFQGRVDTLFALWDSEPWDMFAIHFMDTDRLGHFMFNFLDSNDPENINYIYYLDFLRKIDHMIGEIRAKLTDDVTLIIMSDHGFCRIKKEVQLNNWLREKGYLKFARPPRNDLDFEAISPESMAFSLVPGRVYILREDRWRNGRVKENKYKTVRDGIINYLGNLRCDGEAVCKRIFEKEEVFAGPYMDRAPDIVVDPVDGYDLKAGLKKEALFDVGAISGMHTYYDAMLYIQGGKSYPKRPVIWDVTPTVLRILDIAVPEDMDGTSLIRR